MLNESLQKKVARNVRQTAEMRHMPLTRLADMAGVSRAHLFSFLKGEKDITLGWLEKISACLEVDTSELLR